uniref:AAA domain protein n=1 Tax=Rhizobium rhizogenes TaxID=359 RepID=A0A7S4ZV02_RHIRH|nr:AAA family ATPase [Rhizobium rhizogenes]QCL10066.1 AAA domain protein [Rhizobium rhizogenes]
MKYQLNEGRGYPKKASNICFLTRNTWDDFGFKTLFEIVVFDEKGNRHDLGSARIMQREMEVGRAQLPQDPFDELDDSFCSLGSSRDYYIEIERLSADLRHNYLKALRDCVADQERFLAFQDQNAMRSSLLRDVSVEDVTQRFPRILNGDAQLTPWNFWFDFQSTADGMTMERCGFRVEPESRPPTNIHIVIGRNGVGKTRLLAGMADWLMNTRDDSIGIRGQFTFGSDLEQSNDFLNLVVVSFSAFDRFDPLPSRARTETGLPYFYIGIKTNDGIGGGVPGRGARIKSPDELQQEFLAAIRNVVSDPKRTERWLEAVRTISSDPGIYELKIEDLFRSEDGFEIVKEMATLFSRMSSGHKIVVLTLTRLIENISDRSLVLIDEPETHLHPPLLGSFVRALSRLLISRNAVAIVATHSPVVLQEVPASCVSVLMRSGESLRVIRPDNETFAENVSVLTRKVFGLEVEQSGFYKLLQEAALGQSFDQVIDRFDDQIGGEGRALTRAFISREE